jgi:hypothetical protein
VLLNNDVVVTGGWLDQLIALANAKSGREEDVTGENAETKTEEEREWRPAVDSGAGSGDPRTALDEACGRFGCGVGRPAHSARRDLRSIRVRGREMNLPGLAKDGT